MGFIPGKQAPYIGFLAANPSAMTSLGILIDKINDGTVERNDYVHAMTSLGGVALGIAELAALGFEIQAAPLFFGLGIGLAALDYADEHGYDPTEIKDDLSQKLDILNDMLNDSSDWLDSSLDGMSSDINDLFNDSKSTDSSHISPLVLDLDGDGIETFGILAETHVVFDHDGDGVRNGTGWVKSDDGILVLDRNNNGTIDDGSELFGVYTKVNGTRAENGFVALQSEDSNGDDKFDANDTNFANVIVWRDMDSDGVSDSEELFTLTNWYSANNKIENIIFEDGTVLQSDSDISSLFATTNNDNSDIFIINSKTAYTITDFSSVDDKIYLENAVFADQDLIQTGNLNSAFFKDLTNGGTRDSNDYFLYNQNTGNLFYDQEGFGGAHGAILIATITDNMGNHPSITYSNLVII